LPDQVNRTTLSKNQRVTNGIKMAWGLESAEMRLTKPDVILIMSSLKEPGLVPITLSLKM
jgi:hypothetical protein